MNSNAKGKYEMKNEEWREIPGTNGLYQASSLGRIKRAVRYRNSTTDGIIKPYLNKRNSYVYVPLSINNKKSTQRLHKFIALAFLGPKPYGMQINHKDGCKQNNAADNLEYISQSDNMLHAYANGLQKPNLGSNAGMSKLKEADIPTIISMENRFTHSEIAKKFGVTRKAIGAVFSGFTWSHITGRSYANRRRKLGSPRKCEYAN